MRKSVVVPAMALLLLGCATRDMASRDSAQTSPPAGSATMASSAVPAGSDADHLVEQGRAAMDQKQYGMAMQSFLLAANAGDRRAQNEIGKLYLQGNGVPRNDNLAKQWFVKSADQGYVPAYDSLGILYRDGQGLMNIHYALARRWFQKAAVQDDLLGEVNLAQFYAKGQGTHTDYGQAGYWFQKAIAQASATHQTDGYIPTSIGFAYENRWGIPKDDQKAQYWFNIGAQLGNEDAKMALVSYTATAH